METHAEQIHGEAVVDVIQGKICVIRANRRYCSGRGSACCSCCLSHQVKLQTPHPVVTLKVVAEIHAADEIAVVGTVAIVEGRGQRQITGDAGSRLPAVAGVIPRSAYVGAEEKSAPIGAGGTVRRDRLQSCANSIPRGPRLQCQVESNSGTRSDS